MRTVISTYFLFCVILNGIFSSPLFRNRTYVEPEHLKNLHATGQYEEFAKLLRIENVDLVKPSKGKDLGNPMRNKRLERGDILPRSWQLKQAGQSLFDSSDEISKWNNYAPYVIVEFNYSSYAVSRISEGIEKWNQDLLPNIGFRPHEGEEDYIVIFNGEGCYSDLGRMGGAQPLSLDNNGCLDQGTILHELSHAVGIIHEHERMDRDDYIELLPQNIPKEWLSQYLKFNASPILGPYDYYSLMHYEVLAPDSDLPAFRVLEDGIDLERIGKGNAQTQTDKEKIMRLYG